MIPKVECCLDALRGGVRKTHIDRRPRAPRGAARDLHDAKASAPRSCAGTPRRASEPRSASDRRPDEQRARSSRATDRYAGPGLRPLSRSRSCAARAARLWDADGKQYLDFFAEHRRHQPRPRASGVVARHPRAGEKLLHVSNLHYCEPQARLAELLVEHSFAERVFLCNSGAEANEAAIKLARRYGHASGDGRFEIITALGSFHGRTLATIAATGQEKVPRRLRAAAARASATCRFDDVAALERGGARPRPSRSWSSRSRAKAASSCRARGYSRGAARALRRAAAAADLRRGADRHGTHRHAVRLRAGRRHARRHDARQGARRRRADRRDAGDASASPPRSTPARTARPSAATPLTCAVGVAVLETLRERGRAGELPRRGRAPARGARARSPSTHADDHATCAAAACSSASSSTEPGRPDRRPLRSSAGLIINCTAETVLRLAAAADRQRGRGRRGAWRSSKGCLRAHEARSSCRSAI